MKRPQDVCKHIKREGEGCPKLDCRYPDCAIEQLQQQIKNLTKSIFKCGSKLNKRDAEIKGLKKKLEKLEKFERLVKKNVHPRYWQEGR